MRNILIIGYYRSAYDKNKGDESIVASSVNMLRRFIPNARFTMFNLCADHFFNTHGLNRSRGQIPQVGIVRLSLNISLFLQCILRNLLRRFGINLRTTSFIGGKVLSDYDNADIIVNMTMDGYSEKSGILAVIDKSLEILLCAFLGKPVVMFAQSVGPFNKWPFTPIARLTLNKTRLILLREDTSYENIRGLKLETPIHVTACPVFTFQAAPKERVVEVLLAEGVQLNQIRRPLIGVSLNSDMGQVILSKGNRHKLFLRNLGRLLRFSLPSSLFRFLYRIAPYGKKMNQARQQQIVEILDYLTENLGGTMVLIPHDYGVAPLHDDKLYTAQIFNQLNCKENVRFIQGNYSAEEVKGVIGQCDLCIGEKLHACIAALSQCIPTVGIGYSSKFQGVFKQTAQEQYLCSELSKEEIVVAIQHILINREQIKQELRLKTEEIKQRALLNGALVKKLVEDND